MYTVKQYLTAFDQPACSQCVQHYKTKKYIPHSSLRNVPFILEHILTLEINYFKHLPEKKDRICVKVYGLACTNSSVL